MEPDINKFNDWPRHSPPWYYKGCPAKKKHIPLVGHTYLLHLWQNPSHSDLQTDKSHPQHSIGRWLRRISSMKNRTTEINTQSESNNNSSGSVTRQDIELAETNTDPPADSAATTHKSQDDRWSYVFLRTPKIGGEQLIPHDEDPPEAWVSFSLCGTVAAGNKQKAYGKFSKN